MTGSSEPVLMERLTVRDLEEVLEQTQTVILPLGCVEQHGYHLPLSVDMYNGMEFAKRVSARTGAVVAPLLPYTFSGGELPGTVNVNPHTVSLFVQDICRSLYSQGFKRIMVLFGHGGTENMRDVREGLKTMLRLDKNLKELTIIAVSGWDVSPSWTQSFKDRNFHAARVETSLMLYWASEQVRDEYVRDEPDIAEMLRDDPDAYQVMRKNTKSEFEIPHVDQDERIKVGVIGEIEGASAEYGEKVAEEVVSGLCKVIEEIEGTV